MRLVTAYAAGRLVFGGVALLAPAATGRMLAGEGAATPDAQAFIRGIGGREVGLGLGLLRAVREQSPVSGWLAAGVLFDAGDVAGIAGAWADLAPDKRLPGLVSAAGAVVAGAVLLLARSG
jgi:hypothetical protein